ncbi:MAG: FHA domain-containing protein [Acidimicrobiaceae bacterium]|nr:FHA domain-containing protein [Acidimicrobiaceae bacterium]
MGGASLVGSDGQCHRLGSSTVIGRRDDCEIVLDGPKVSRRHAQISSNPDGLLLVDLASVNGTLLNGIEVTSERLSHGDVVTIGTHDLRLEMD